MLVDMARWLMTERSHKMLFSASGIVLSWVYEKVAILRGYALDAKDWKNIEQGVTTMIDRLVVDLTAIVKTPYTYDVCISPKKLGLSIPLNMILFMDSQVLYYN